MLDTYLKNNSVPPEKLESVIRMFSGLSASAAPATAVRAPAARAERPVASARRAAKTGAKTSAKAKAAATTAAKATEAMDAKAAKAKAKADEKAAKAKAKADAKAAKAKAKADAKAAKKAKAASPAAAVVRPRKQVAKAGNNGSIVIDVAIPTKSLKAGKVSRRKFLGIRQVNDPAVPIDASVEDDFIVCLEDGKKFKMMKRWLRATYGMSPEEYKAKWGLPEDYPMVAPGYAREKSDYAKIQGLGTAPNKQHKSATVHELNQAVR